MSENEYLMLIGKGDLRPLLKQFKEMGGFFTGSNWVFPSNCKPILTSIVANLPNHWIHRSPISEGNNFESYRQLYKAKFLKKLLNELDSEIVQMTNTLNLSDLAFDSIQELNIDEDGKDALFEKLQRRDNLKESIAHAEGMEKSLKAQQPAKISIKFISELEINYLLEDAPDMPRLVNYIEGGQQKPFIPKGIVAQLVGAGGVGKTHALAQLALSIATGSNWLGVYPIEKAGYVFMCLGENKEEDIHRLLRKIVKSKFNIPDATFFAADPLGEAAKRISVMSCTGTDATFIHDGLPTNYYNALLQALKDAEPEEGWSLIILDPISRFLGAEAETDNAAATKVIALLEKITLELKGQPTLIFGHHMNKAGVNSTNTNQGAARGSSAITDGVRWQANLERVEKEAKQGEEQTFELNQVALRVVKSNFTAIIPAQKLIKDKNGCLQAEKGASTKTAKTDDALDRRF